MILENSVNALLIQPNIKTLFKVLEPFDARLVGGCVRDALLGLASTDIDVAVAAPPQQIAKHLEKQGVKVIPTGIEFGTITAVINHQGFQITSLRQDVKTDGRHAEVLFGTDWLEDAKRRDFSINALSVDAQGVLYDYFKGEADLRLGQIRFIGDAEHRIREDYLRILRYYRFLAHFGKNEPIPIPALRELRAGLKQLSIERIQQEVLKLLSAPDSRTALKLMEKDGIFEALYDYPVDLAFLFRLIEVEENLKLSSNPLCRLWALFYDQGIIFYQTYFRLGQSQLRFLKKMSAEIVQADKRWVLYKHGCNFFESWRLLRACSSAEINLAYIKEDLGWAHAQPLLILPLTGQDLLNQGMPPGPAVGRLLKACEQWWVENDFRPTLQDCLAYCEKLTIAGSI